MAKAHRVIGQWLLALSTTFAVWPLSAQVNAPSDPRLARTRPESKSGAAGRVISVELLRYPISEKARRMLQRALAAMDSGNHEAAIGQLTETLAKYPESAAYADSLLGIEYLKTDHFTAAVDSLEKAVSLLPHDAVNRYNLGLSLACAGDYERSEQEVRRALEIDPKNATMQAFLNALLQYKNSRN
jgi:tetratricopeptide (TPR) repeat protein